VRLNTLGADAVGLVGFSASAPWGAGETAPHFAFAQDPSRVPEILREPNRLAARLLLE
jgi:hypothetical protein